MGVLLSGGCVQNAALPALGDCAVTPEGGLYEFGQIGVGTCLASPSDLQVLPDPQDPTNHFVMVVNSNAYSNFEGSSVLTIDASTIDLTCPANGLHEVSAFSLEMQEFAGRMAIDEARGLGLMSARVNGQFDGDLTDVVFTLDMSDPRALAFSDAGPRRWGPFRYIQVSADPWSVRINPWDGRAYVLGLTDHTVAALDLVSDPIGFVDLIGDLAISGADFADGDSSGSAPDFTLQSVVPLELEDEVLTLTFQEGTTRLYFGADDGTGTNELVAVNSGDGIDFVPLAGGAIVEPEVEWAEAGVVDASVGFFGDGQAALLTGVAADGRRSIGRMSSAESAVEWTVATNPVITPTESAWDSAGVFGPDWVDDGLTVDVYFSGGPGWGTSIGHAEGSSFGSLTRVGDETLPDGAEGEVLGAAVGSWDSAAVFGPSVIEDGLTGRRHLYYSGHDGVPLGDLDGATAIGLAVSDDDVTFARTDRGLGGGSTVLEPGEAGAWDDLGVAWPTVFFDNGRWQMWYRGTDGVSWQVGRATSVDGFVWTKDPRNPVVGEGLEAPVGTDAPLRVFAQKVSPRSGYFVEGEISGEVAALAFEGEEYANTVSPIGFLVVGGQALGRGPAGTYDRDGAAAASRLDDTDLVFYEAVRGTRATLAVGQDLGAGVERISAVTAAGWTDSLDGLNGDAPTVALHEPDARVSGGDTVVAFSTTQGISVGRVGYVDGVASTLEPLVPGVALAASADEFRFDSAGVSSPSLLTDGHDGATRLAYEGARGDVTAIGIALGPTPEGPFVRPDAVSFPRGGAGTWDDASVGSPSLLWDEDAGLYRLWYLGSDGATYRVGMATSADGLSWDRYSIGETTLPVFEPSGLAFLGADGPEHIAVRRLPTGRFEMWFHGELDGVPRVGRAVSEDGISWSSLVNPTTAGDTFTITTRAGDDSASTAIDLGEPPKSGEDDDATIYAGPYRVHGAGATEMILSPDGRFGVVSNKRTDFVLVVDLTDDSTDDWTDANAFGVEAAFRIPQRFGVVGTRDLAFSPDGTKLYVTLAPQIIAESGDPEFRTGVEGLITLDWTQVEDLAESTLLLDDTVLSWAPLARGAEEDVGYRNDTSVGANAFVLNKAGDRAYVANANDNSLWIIALDTGARGTVIERATSLGESPTEVVLSPDESVAYVSNYIGQDRNSVVNSTIAVVDVVETSETFGEVLTTLSNITSRSDRGCE
ncbi:MAG: hypothetical protein KDA24_18185 [Deltaproteobacteria bacterium]|nr:hypothetical protein [Deltaproteobacteria bacterium]